MKSKSSKRKPVAYKLVLILVFLVFALASYYYIDYERFYISNNNQSKYITLWKRLGGDCYIIPGMYKSIYKPENNYLTTKNDSYLYLIWDPSDLSEHITLFIGSSKVEKFNLIPSIELIETREDFFYNYIEEYADTSNAKLVNQVSERF